MRSTTEADLVEQRMDRLLDDDTSEIADDARATIPRLHHLWCGTPRRFDLTTDDSDEEASLHSSGALLVDTQWRPAPRRRGQGQGGGRD